jgi:thiol-disulfide isomerase/thioredoxin
MTDSYTHSAGRTKRSRRNFLAATGVVGTGVLGGCLGGGDSGGSDDDSGASEGEDMSQPSASDGTDSSDEMMAGDWWSTELETVRDGETFTIESLDAPVVIQSFAVWCPKCERQSNQLAGLDSAITKLSLNTDPNEDAGKVQDHAEANGFDWRFAVSPTEMTESLVDEFGSAVTNAPSTPIIVVCGDGTTTFKSGSVNAASEIKSIADEC